MRCQKRKPESRIAFLFYLRLGHSNATTLSAKKWNWSFQPGLAQKSLLPDSIVCHHQIPMVMCTFTFNKALTTDLRMKRVIVNFYATLRVFGFDPLRLAKAVRSLPFYFRTLSELKKQKGSDKTFPFGRTKFQLADRSSEAGTMSGHYFHQDLLVAKKIFRANPKKHVDIGSRIDGFVAHVAVFREIEVLDIREQKSKVKNIIFKEADLMQPQGLENYCDSISSLHAIEHFGLGRYGDPIDYFGYLKAIDNITGILQQGGKFYFSVPIGSQRIEFNAHRVFSVRYLLDLFKTRFTINSFSYVNDKGDLFEDVELIPSAVESNFNCYWGCGIFELTKI